MGRREREREREEKQYFESAESKQTERRVRREQDGVAVKELR